VASLKLQAVHRRLAKRFSREKDYQKRIFANLVFRNDTSLQDRDRYTLSQKFSRA